MAQLIHIARQCAFTSQLPFPVKVVSGNPKIDVFLSIVESESDKNALFSTLTPSELGYLVTHDLYNSELTAYLIYAYKAGAITLQNIGQIFDHNHDECCELGREYHNDSIVKILGPFACEVFTDENQIDLWNMDNTLHDCLHNKVSESGTDELLSQKMDYLDQVKILFIASDLSLERFKHIASVFMRCSNNDSHTCCSRLATAVLYIPDETRKVFSLLSEHFDIDLARVRELVSISYGGKIGNIGKLFDDSV